VGGPADEVGDDDDPSDTMSWIDARLHSGTVEAHADSLHAPSAFWGLGVGIQQEAGEAVVSVRDSGVGLPPPMGHETRIAHDGLEAVEIAEHFHPEVVLLDLGMPKLDGYEAVRRMAARPWARSSLLVAIAGWGQEADRQRTQEAGFHRHLVKPVDLDALGQFIDGARTRS
jgi:CheY-like chemotaxis protein